MKNAYVDIYIYKKGAVHKSGWVTEKIRAGIEN